MTTIAHHEPRRVTGGVDTHKDVHVAAVLDEVGRLVASENFPTTRQGYRRLLRWLRSHGELVAVGVEGCGSWGAGLARFLAAREVTVVEVNRPNRQNRRRRGKSTPSTPKRLPERCWVARPPSPPRRHGPGRGGPPTANRPRRGHEGPHGGRHPTQAYVERRTAEGLSKPEIMRCLKRHVARELFPLIQAITGPSLLEEGGTDRTETAA